MNENFSVFFGTNGIGKSSILEALDSIFNNRPWNINKFAQSHGLKDNVPYIVPVFLIKKERLPDKKQADKTAKIKADKLNKYIWEVQGGDISGQSSGIGDFFVFRDQLKNLFSPDEYFLLPIGINYDQSKNYDKSKKIFFGPFQYQDSFLKRWDIDPQKDLDSEKDYGQLDTDIQNYFDGLFEYIFTQYSYIYIPSDIDVQNYTKLENQDMQKLMHKDIQDEIKNAITQANLDSINNSLHNFVKGISEELVDYTYRKPGGGASNIVMPDLISKIIDTYFSIRVLSKKNDDKYIPVSDLSSGEKRKALVDLAFAFLHKESKHEKKIILGIDEPEVSLHVSACFAQFEKLREIAERDHQVIITTHWYGFLPVTNAGYAHNVYESDNTAMFSTYSLEKYQEEITLKKKHNKGELPFDISLKSINDLVQSIIASMRTDTPYSYIFCEGSSDSLYLKHYLSKYLDKEHLRILPLGGCGEITKLMQKLTSIIIDKTADIKGKILGLIDTDVSLQKIEDIKELENFWFRRLLYNEEKNDIELISANSLIGSPVTQIEDTLDPEVFFETIKQYQSNAVNSIINDNSYNKLAQCTHNIVDFSDSGRKLLKDFFKENETRKTEFAKKYIKLASKERKPKLFQDIIKLFKFENENPDNLIDKLQETEDTGEKKIIERPKPKLQPWVQRQG